MPVNLPDHRAVVRSGAAAARIRPSVRVSLPRRFRLSPVRAHAEQNEALDNKQPVVKRRMLLAGFASAVAGCSILLRAEAAAVKAPSANVELVKGMLADQVAGNVDSVLKHQAKNVVWRLPVAYANDPLGGEFQGKKGVLVYLTRLGAQTKDMQLKDLKFQESGRNEVIAQFRMSGKLKGTSKFSTSVTQVWCLTGDGTVASMAAYYDTASIVKAAGINKSVD